MSKNRDFKGIWIPAKIWLSEELTLQEKVFLVEIDSLDNEAGCWANNQYFAEFFKISKTRVSLIIKSLVDKGYVFTQVDASKGNKRILSTSQTKVKEVIKESLRGSLRKVKDPRKGKLKHNNTVNNTSNNTIEEEKENTPPSFVLENRKKAKANKKAYEQRVNFKDVENPISDLETFINTNLIDKLNKYPSFSQMKHKEEFIKDFSEKAITEDWNDSDDLTLHISRSIKFFTPKDLPQAKRAQVKYVYKINGSEYRHSDKKKFEMDKRNFTGYGFEEIRVNA